MRLIVSVFLFSLLLPAVGLAQKTDDVLLSRPHEKGMLYHLTESELNASKGSEISIDFTYLPTESNDSARVMITVLNKEIKGLPSSATISCSSFDSALSFKHLKVLYVEKKKKNWVTRIETQLSEQDFLKLLKAGHFTLNLSFADGECSAETSKKLATVYQEVATILEYN